MKGRVILLAVVVTLCVLALSGCTRSLETSEGVTEVDGVTVELMSADVKMDGDLSRFETKTKITNGSDQGIMLVEIHMTVLDKQGNNLFDLNAVYNGETKAIAPGESVIYERPFQRVLDGQAYSVNIDLLSVTTAEELPPVQLPEQGEPLYQYLMNDGMPDITQTTPKSITVGIDQEGYLREAVFDTPSTAKQAADAFAEITVGEEFNEFVTDNYNYIVIEFEDGQYYGAHLNLHNLEVNANGAIHIYELEGLGTLWDMAVDNAHDVNFGEPIQDS